MVLKVWPVFLVGLLLAGPARAQESDLDADVIASGISQCKAERALVLYAAKTRNDGMPESEWITLIHDGAERHQREQKYQPLSQAEKNQIEADELRVVAEVYAFRSLPGEYLAEQVFQRCIEKIGQ